ncbi:MAG: sigma 54-interacting transcriptional regulator, partial [Pseudomonadota bacterium]|nr:sigma 54-interacting transcriptional regulator [Pseudomonadota bacterium]
HGYYVSGKFDQLRLTVPYSAIVAALSDLVAQLLTEPDDALMAWKDKLLESLDGNGQLVIDVIPEVRHIIGTQPPIPELDITESRHRFRLVLKNFIRVFCQPEHPLAVFVDDLQWVDPASLALIDTILTDEDSHHLLIIGAYRDNEVDDSHPLTAAVDAIGSEAHVRVSRLVLGPMSPVSVKQLLQDTLHSKGQDVDRLQHLVFDKTAGNPFFLKQFLTMLYLNSAITFDHASNRWVWDIDALEAMNITNNVVDLMVSRLEELPKATSSALALAACIGNRFDLATLESISDDQEAAVREQIRPAIEAGLIVRDRPEWQGRSGVSGPSWLRFLHDRVQQTAYGILSERARAELHLKIGQALMSSAPDPAKSTNLFLIVDHHNVGNELIKGKARRRELAILNLEAARKAVSAIAYGAACDYALAGLGYLFGDYWKTDYELTRDLHRVQLDAEYLRGDFETSQRLIRTLLSRLHTPLEIAEVQSALVVQLTLSGDYRQAITTCYEALTLLDIDMPTEDLETALHEELDHYSEIVSGRKPESLVELPEVTSLKAMVALRLLANLCPLSYIADPPLSRVAAIKMVNLALTYGHTRDSALGYAFFGLVHSSVLHNYGEAYSFGQLAMALSNKYADAAQLCRTTHVFCAFINHWTRHLRNFDAINSRGFQAGLQAGELQFAGYHRYNRALCLFHLGTNLKELVPELEELVRFSRKTHNQHATDPIVAVMRAARDLSGDTPEPGSFVIEQTSDQAFVNDLDSRNALPTLCHYGVLKSQVLYLYGRIEDAQQHSEAAVAYLPFVSGHISVAIHEFYAALIAVALAERAADEVRPDFIEKIKQRQRQLQRWADSCPDNFLHKSLLVSAEIARLEDEGWKAAELYDRAIEAAGHNEFFQEEALACERAGLFWLGQERHKIAALYLSEANHGYQLWGASRKARMLAEEHGDLIAAVTEGSRSTDTASMPFLTVLSSTGAALDFATVMKASREISREVNLGELVKKLVRIAVESAGAQRGCLLLSREGTLMIEATSTLEQGEHRYRPPIRIDSSENIPPGIVNFVARTKQTLTITDALEDPRFSQDTVVLRSQPRSVLCVPITSRGDLAGVLYLEHALAAGVFSSDRVEILQSLMAQAAISLENAALYEERKRAEDALRKALGEVERLKNRLEQENLYLQEEIETEHKFGEILGQSAAIKNMLQAIQTVAPTDVNVVITGETGTGKELVARALHNTSDRKDMTLIKVNCASIPKDLFESEFFGHIKGAFTGALRNRVGRFELADKGTLFLDEVGEIPIDMQSKLLRVLQEGEFERVGEEKTRRIDVRIIAATNRNLKQEVEAGHFREDLFYRLNVFPIEVAPLRHRKEDIPRLAEHFLRQAAQTLKRSCSSFTETNVQQLQNYDWPGNIRELQNVIERAVIVAQGNQLRFDLPGTAPTQAMEETDEQRSASPDGQIVRETDRKQRDRETIIAALQKSGGKVAGVGGAAEILGIKPTTLYSRIKALSIKRSSHA